jgi:hypothetical protein
VIRNVFDARDFVVKEFQFQEGAVVILDFREDEEVAGKPFRWVKFQVGNRCFQAVRCAGGYDINCVMF